MAKMVHSPFTGGSNSAVMVTVMTIPVKSSTTPSSKKQSAETKPMYSKSG